MAVRPTEDDMRHLRPWLIGSVVALSALGCTGGHAPAPAGGDPARPRVMAALGDSITRGFAACGRGGDCVASSWATGTAEGLSSHAQRLGLGADGGGHNVAVSGAQVTGLASQVDAAVRVRPDYVTILIGANDACARDEAAMTPVGQYTSAFDAALNTLADGVPEARILVLSIPDLARLWEVGRDRPDVRRAWESFGICQSMLADPADRGPVAQARRDRVRDRVRAYNAAMSAACARHGNRCRYDGGAVFDHRFDLDDVSTVDFWHPSGRGQATLARVAWNAGFWR